MSSRERQARGRDHRRAYIAEAAASVFAQKGYHGATMDEIARAAGYSPAALYKYFRNKEAIFRAVVEAIGEEFLSVFKQGPVEGMALESELRWLLSRIFEVFQRNRDLFINFTVHRELLECGLGEEELGRLMRDIHQEYTERMTAIMQRGVEAGALRGEAAVHHALAFMGISHAFIRRWVHDEQARGMTLDSQSELIVRLFMEGARPRSGEQG